MASIQEPVHVITSINQIQATERLDVSISNRIYICRGHDCKLSYNRCLT
jgi:hypothetical protein